jgi:hypothetical protein
MKLQHLVKKYRQRAEAAGSPVRYLRKAFLTVAHAPEHARRTSLGSALGGELSADSREKVRSLNETGYALAGSEIDTALRDGVARLVTERLQNGAREKGKSLRSYFTRISDDSDLTTDNIFVRFALQPEVIRVISAYFGQVPYLADLQILMSHGSDSTKWEESQLWHRDYADSKTVKLWMYLTDVDSIEKGPFTYLPLKESQQVPNGLFPGRVSDEAMQQCGLAARAATVYGERLTTFYMDTSRCYHLGSRLKGENIRVAYVATFITHASLYPFENRIRINTPLTDLEQLVLTTHA